MTPRDHLHLVGCCGNDLSRPPGAPGQVSLGCPDNHDVEGGAVQESGGQGSEFLVIGDKEMLEELLGEVVVVMAKEDQGRCGLQYRGGS